MTEEGQPPVVENPEAPENPPVQPKGRWEGKTPEELVAIIEEQDKRIGEQSAEVGQLRTKTSNLENELSFTKRFERPAETEPSPFESRPTPEEGGGETPSDYWTRPKYYHDKWAEEREQKRQETLMKRDAEIRENVQKARPVTEEAKKETPHVFKDVTQQDMDTGVYTWLANKWILPHQLGDFAAHRRIATWVRGERTGYTFSPTSTGSPVPPTRTESYVGDVKPESAEEISIEKDALTAELLRNRPKKADGTYKDTEQEFLRKVRETQKRGGR